jgi:hypothetical protein
MTTSPFQTSILSADHYCTFSLFAILLLIVIFFDLRMRDNDLRVRLGQGKHGWKRIGAPPGAPHEN